MNLSNFRKFVAAASGAVGVAVADGLLSGDVQKWVVGGIAVLTALLVGLVPNTPAAPNA